MANVANIDYFKDVPLLSGLRCFSFADTCLFVTQGGATCYLIFINAQGLTSVQDGTGLSKKHFLSLSLPVSFEVELWAVILFHSLLFLHCNYMQEMDKRVRSTPFS